MDILADAHFRAEQEGDVAAIVAGFADDAEHDVAERPGGPSTAATRSRPSTEACSQTSSSTGSNPSDAGTATTTWSTSQSCTRPRSDVPSGSKVAVGTCKRGSCTSSSSARTGSRARAHGSTPQAWRNNSTNDTHPGWPNRLGQGRTRQSSTAISACRAFRDCQRRLQDARATTDAGLTVSLPIRHALLLYA
jgi:hypothetical protein